jgi:hypothetical protein
MGSPVWDSSSEGKKMRRNEELTGGKYEKAPPPFLCSIY